MATTSIAAIFKSGKNTNGNKATTGIGKASLTHKVIIKKATVITLFALTSNPKGFKKYKVIDRRAQIIIAPVFEVNAAFKCWFCYSLSLRSLLYLTTNIRIAFDIKAVM